MTGAGGQASAEYAALLAVAALLGAGLALMAGTAVARCRTHGIRQRALGRGASPGANRRHRGRHRRCPIGARTCRTDAGRGAARTGRASWTRACRRRSPARSCSQRPARPNPASARRTPTAPGRTSTTVRTRRAVDGSEDRDVETPTGAPVALWITVAAHHRAISAALAHHTSLSALALDTRRGHSLRTGGGCARRGRSTRRCAHGRSSICRR